ncbi:MAG: hypothetical protein K0S28_1754, partial [Paucimonas sp.]|nr:hypothetical protein [Paucimonas sp.]
MQRRYSRGRRDGTFDGFLEVIRSVRGIFPAWMTGLGGLVVQIADMFRALRLLVKTHLLGNQKGILVCRRFLLASRNRMIRLGSLDLLAFVFRRHGD